MVEIGNIDFGRKVVEEDHLFESGLMENNLKITFK
jgi:hypothetical protein